MAPNQTHHRVCRCGREFQCGDAIQNECPNCRTLNHPGDCTCIDCRLILASAPARPMRWQDIDTGDGFDGLGLCPSCGDVETRNGHLCVSCQRQKMEDEH